MGPLSSFAIRPLANPLAPRGGRFARPAAATLADNHLTNHPALGFQHDLPHSSQRYSIGGYIIGRRHRVVTYDEKQDEDAFPRPAH
jgi:hypothetical protein